MKALPVAVELPVLIAGAGPVGLTLAADLGRRGIGCLVIEENPDVKQHPRAMGIIPVTMEHFRLWGLDRDIYGVSLPHNVVGDIVHVTRICGYELVRFPSPSVGEALAPSPEVIARTPLLAHSPYSRRRALDARPARSRALRAAQVWPEARRHGTCAGSQGRRVPLAIVDVPDEAAAGIYAKQLVLVRPDGIVAWRGDSPPADPLALLDLVRGAG